MYVVHICEGYGVGELAIALTGEVQTVACNYQSDDDEKPSKPLVNGRLVWQDDSAVFSGTWFDPDSENEASDVLITVDGCDLTVSVCAPESPSRLIGRHIDIVGDLIAELDTSHFTVWCGASIPPTLPGVYAVQWPDDESHGSDVYYAVWDGVDWFGPTETVKQLSTVHLAWRLIDDAATMTWRGLTRKSNNAVAASIEREYSRHCEKDLPDLVAKFEHARDTLRNAWDSARERFHTLQQAVRIADQFNSTDRRILKSLNLARVAKDFEQDPSEMLGVVPDGSLEDKHEYFTEARRLCNEQTGDWHAYWAKFPKLDGAMEKSGMAVVDWDRWLDSFHNGTWRRLHGSYGTGKA